MKEALLAAREPLTDEQIDEITNTVWATPRGHMVGWIADHREFARAIEAAHGIGTKE